MNIFLDIAGYLVISGLALFIRCYFFPFRDPYYFASARQQTKNDWHLETILLFLFWPVVAPITMMVVFYRWSVQMGKDRDLRLQKQAIEKLRSDREIEEQMKSLECELSTRDNNVFQL
jgi:hypothetical protein